MSPYIHFTEDQKRRAATVDLVDFLNRRGEKLIRSGPEYRLGRDRSVTVRGNAWYDHAIERGGGPISFVQNFYNLSYPEAVTRLLDGEQGQPYELASKKPKEEPKEFVPPPAAQNMRRLYAYLLKKRFIDREVLNAFVRAGLIYESREKSKDGQREFHHAVFVGHDEHDVARHAHKRGVSDLGKTFRINVEGCDPRYSFHYQGDSDRLYVFEAPIDMLSYLTLYPKDWQRHSYVALCGTAEHAMLWMLAQNPQMNHILLCLDHDEAGIEAAGRLADSLAEKGFRHVETFQSVYKDWNEDLKAKHGMEAQPAEEHPQRMVAPELCQRICSMSETIKLDRLHLELPELLTQYQSLLRRERPERAMECMERMAALALAVYRRELRQMGRLVAPEVLVEVLSCQLQPHQNRGTLKGRHSEIYAEVQRVLAQSSAVGLRTRADKQALADEWLKLAVSCAKIPIKYEADQLKRQKQEKSMTMQLGVSL